MSALTLSLILLAAAGAVLALAGREPAARPARVRLPAHRRQD
jgi:hypothetical protein